MAAVVTNLFGINVTENESAREITGDVFITKIISLKREYEEIEQFPDKEDELIKKKHFPMVLSVVKEIAWFAWVLVLYFITARFDSMEQALQDALILFWVLGISFILWLVLFIYEKMSRKRVVKSEESEEYIDHSGEIIKKAKQILEIPEDAPSIDVLSERYVIKKGKIKHKKYGLSEYLNLDLYIFERNGKLCLADVEQIWEIPMTSFHSITFEKKRRGFPIWNKEEAYNSKKYKPYKVTMNSLSEYFSRCYRVEIDDIYGQFYMLIPVYDGEIFMNLTHLRLTE